MISYLWCLWLSSWFVLVSGQFRSLCCYLCCRVTLMRLIMIWKYSQLIFGFGFRFFSYTHELIMFWNDSSSFHFSVTKEVKIMQNIMQVIHFLSNSVSYYGCPKHSSNHSSLNFGVSVIMLMVLWVAMLDMI